jgi:hypothetical protein
MSCFQRVCVVSRSDYVYPGFDSLVMALGCHECDCDEDVPVSTPDGEQPPVHRPIPQTS